MAGGLGFEPRQTESESVVLPLHNSPIATTSFSLRMILYYEAQTKSTFFYGNLKKSKLSKLHD